MADWQGSSLQDRGRAAFGTRWRPARAATAPGRLELLGNHVDYNGGQVLAGAIDRVIQAIAGESNSRDTVRLFAPDVDDEIASIVVEHPAIDDSSPTTPADYLAGIIQALHEARVPIRGGQDIVVSGDVPVGFGMSSSAALCISLTLLLADTALDPDAIVRIARHAEHLNGAPVGAMDQSASVAGGIILFDGATNGIEQLSPDLGEWVFAVANSGVYHALSSSQYPQRVRESEEALSIIRRIAGDEIPALGALSLQQWDNVRRKAPEELTESLHRRVEHVVTEVARVQEGVNAVRENDWRHFGELMTASGQSSATVYEISHPEVEELVEVLLSEPGVLGARMMGGGEGGPALSLLHRDVVETVREALDNTFFGPRNMDASAAFEVCRFGPGARIDAIT